jgi:SAM-dependent methyltransferase
MAPAPGSPAPADAWQVGSAYEAFVGRWSRRVAPDFIEWLALPGGLRWLDIGCGTGALSRAILDGAEPRALVGVDPSAGFLAAAAHGLPPAVLLCRTGAEALPLSDASFDVVVSGLVLNFLPDLPRALAEMHRVLVPGGQLAAYVWDYAQGMALLRHFWAAATSLDPRAKALDEGVRFPLCRPPALLAALTTAGWRDVEVMPLDVATPFETFEACWTPFLGGQGPAPTYVASLTADARVELAAALRARLPIAADGSVPLTARAWAVRARRPD